MLGETIREYEIVSELGAGGYGVVYRAHDTNIDRDVAIKVILPQYATQPEFIKNFEAEARLVAQLEHKDIVPLYAYWHDEQGAFLVMRYIRGGSLRSMIAKQGALPLTRAVRIAEQVAEALNVAHDAGVIHRDLKPDNILIDERGNAYLTDFGIAKRLSDDDPKSATDAIKGTFAYLSPEQIQQTQISPQTDIYAFGIMLYEMLAGQHPFHETPIGMMIMKHLQESVPDVRLIRDTLDGAITDVIYKATAKDPEERYASTLEMVAELKQAINGTASAPIPQPIIEKKKPTTSEERNRYAMMENVRKFWIEGVLENSLHDTAMIDLGMKPESGAVDNHWDTLIRTPFGEESHTDESIANLFDLMNGKLLILGDPGSGKTTTLLNLARDLLLRAEVDEQHPIPVVFNLSSWSENQPPLTEWLIEELNGKYQVPRKVGTQWIENDEVLLLLDGLDEVAENVRDACVQAINSYRSEHGFVDVVVCSRIKDYEALTGQLKLNGAIVIQPLADAQIIQYLDGLGTDVAVVRELITRDTQLRELAQSPLMLSIMVLAYRGKSADDIPDFDNVEAQRQHLFDVYVERMFDRRIGEKPYKREETRHYLGWLARQMKQQAKSVFHIEEMQPSLLPSSLMATYYAFMRLMMIPRMFVVYAIAGWLIASNSILSQPINSIGLGIFGAITGWIFSLRREYWIKPQAHILSGIVLCIATILSLAENSLSLVEVVGSILIGIAGVGANYLSGRLFDQVGNDINHIVPKEQFRISVDAIKPHIGIVGFIFGAFLPVGATLILNPSAGVVDYIASSITSGLAGSIFFTVFTALVSERVSMRIEPNEGIKRSLRNGFTMMHIVAPLFGLVVFAGFPSLTIPVAVTFGLGMFVIFWYASFIFYGGFVYEQHYVLRFLLHRAGCIPTNMMKFLDYSASLVLMRKVGGGYIFIHRYLLEYFADLEDDKL